MQPLAAPGAWPFPPYLLQHVVQAMQHLAQAHADDGHDGKRAKGAREHIRLRSL